MGQAISEGKMDDNKHSDLDGIWTQDLEVCGSGHWADALKPAESRRFGKTPKCNAHTAGMFPE